MKEQTKVFLEECAKKHIKRVAIGVFDDKIKSCSGWHKINCSDSIFADGRDKYDYPAIWNIVRDFGYSVGCGNTGQHQVSREALNELGVGVYQYINNEWIKEK